MPASDLTPGHPSSGQDPNGTMFAAPASIKFVHLPGGFGRLWGTFLITVVLSILTLTLYRFWGLTKLRAQLWARMTLLGDPLE
jgi:hypothetical protein